jgi:DNA-binding PadR family transcriptional regulator
MTRMARFDPASYLPLTPAMFEVLVALADGEKHGYAVIKEVARRTGGRVRLRPTTLYTVLRRFDADGLVAEASERPDPALDDQRRRYFRLTDRGRAVAEAEAERLARTLASARAILHPRGA